MALDLQAPNFSALASLAGTRVGNLGLAVPRTTGWQGLAEGLSSGMDRADKRQQMEASQKLAQQKLGLEQQQQQQQLGLEQQKMGILQQNADRQQSLADRQMMMEERRQKAQEQKEQLQLYQTQLKERALMKKEKLNERGALASAYIVGYKQAGSEEEQMQIKEEMLKHAYQNGLVDDNEFVKLNEMSPKALYGNSMIDLMITDKAKELKSFMGNGKGGNSGGGILGNSTTEKGKQELTKPTQNALQKDIADTLNTIERLKKVGEDYKEGFLTPEGKTKAAIGDFTSRYIPDSVKEALPVGQDTIKSTEDFATRQKGFASELDQLLTQYVKAMSGVQYGVKELEMHKRSVVNSSDSPAAFEGKFKVMTDIMERSLKVKQDLLAKGMDVNSKEFQEKYRQEMEPLIKGLGAADKKSTTPTDSGYTFQGKTYTNDQVDATAKHYGISREEVLKRMGVE